MEEKKNISIMIDEQEWQLLQFYRQLSQEKKQHFLELIRSLQIMMHAHDA